MKVTLLLEIDEKILMFFVNFCKLLLIYTGSNINTNQHIDML